MTWLAIVTAAIKALEAITRHLGDRQLIKAGEAQATSAALQAAMEGVARAQAARDLVRADLARRPDGLRDDDFFKRAD